MNTAHPPLLAWHYTLGAHLLRILENGHILPHDTPRHARRGMPCGVVLAEPAP